MAKVSVTEDAVLEALRVVEDPEVRRSIVEMDMVRHIVIDGSKVDVEIVLTIRGCPMRSVIEDQVRDALLSIPGVTMATITIGTMTDEERDRFATKIRGKEGEETVSPLLQADSSTKFIAVASGKGGVGKSTVTANLAVAFARLGYRVGIVDADIYGFSIPNIFGIADVKPAVVSNLIMPAQTHGLKIVSMHFFVPENRPVIWRGPMLGKMLRNFFQEVHWGELDIMLLDLPPGTGDIALDVHNMLPKSLELIVTTPHVNAADVAVRAGYMAQQVKHDIIGVIENMAYYQCGQCGEKAYLFGQGGGEQVAQTLGTQLLAQIPLGEIGASTTGLFAPESLQGEAFHELAMTLADRLAMQPSVTV
ncbi:MAG: Mrp/NBP35 family ATP-binding protein [Acidibacillus sp.]|uniref:Iron-sulfur cluster carrier protein n=1 Tax=Sulfoacidibacillus ferrooxidans TaxID=2005001 RepID=A0A9X1VAC6_9BACL|nr:Mrp/NBP35 family ATP-binding protein [Sulfoacidibacillus ferrooxidans]MCI0183814.1 Iron-sulfur cluster carrier protein [Sulfoacidibacillus ferrooxidans]MCY0893675.1 Mrp/NBP35 family ATP-binding protein [Acidibacillus sp.]